MQYEELTRKIIGCAMKVHSALGCGFQEVIRIRYRNDKIVATGALVSSFLLLYPG